eukprot:2634143-Karenia_brevis.AAC.1
MVSRHRRVRVYPTDASSSADGGAAAPATPPGQCPGCKGSVEKTSSHASQYSRRVQSVTC